MEDLNVAIRLKGFIDSEGLTHSQFADRCGIPRPSLSQILSGRNKKISDVIVGQIHTAFPQLSVLWLLFGEGPMLMPQDSKSQSSQSSPAGATFPGGNMENSPNLFSDTAEFPTGKTENLKYENVSALNGIGSGAQSTDNKNGALDLKIADLQRQIDKMRRNPRKVSHITVYYDDSTFETFYPKR